MAQRIKRFGNIEAHYELIEHIGGGAQGDLYLGRGLRTEEQVAIKMQREREFESERCFADLARELTREGVYSHLISEGRSGTLKLFGLGDYRGRRCIVLEYVEGVLLYDLMKKFRPLKDVATVASIVGQLCEILDEIHRKEFVHRDLKPENIMVEHSGRVRLLDLGLAIRAGQGTRFGCGTIGYAPPEQLDANPDGVTARADIFALGCLLLELTVMRLPYDGSRAGLLAEVPVVLPAHQLALVPGPFAPLALSMVELAAEKRPGSVRAVFDRIRPHLPSVGAPRPVKPLRPTDPTEHYRTCPPRW
ncbi:serine/threonine-protein kinase [Streptomyces winkii]|uniref:serine/threonine-protein kinase n=1 Tax=Streptomyces winkii TaxID=3051178 RepID=UPI0028D81D62|nr:serine/threonine-protein kinase [Streptomyces sp. DSM 40971]